MYVSSKQIGRLIPFQGIEEKSISSSFTTEQWDEWLEKNIV